MYSDENYDLYTVEFAVFGKCSADVERIAKIIAAFAFSYEFVTSESFKIFAEYVSRGSSVILYIKPNFSEFEKELGDILDILVKPEIRENYIQMKHAPNSAFETGGMYLFEGDYAWVISSYTISDNTGHRLISNFETNNIVLNTQTLETIRIVCKNLIRDKADEFIQYSYPLIRTLSQKESEEFFTPYL